MIVLTLSKLAAIGGSIESHDSGLAVVRFDIPQAGIGRYAIVDPTDGRVLDGFETHSKAVITLDEYQQTMKEAAESDPLWPND